MRRTRIAIAVAALLLATAVRADTKPEAAALPIPQPDALLMLIRTSVIAVGQANAAGNYEVLRALGSTRFRELNSGDALAKTFGPVRELRLDVSPVAVTTPVLTDPPTITEGKLRVYGAFPTTPVEIPFGMLFEAEDGLWKLNAISVGARPAAKVAEATIPLSDSRASGKVTVKSAKPDTLKK